MTDKSIVLHAHEKLYYTHNYVCSDSDVAHLNVEWFLQTDFKSRDGINSAEGRQTE